jgi:hypothetical protein
MISVPMIAEGVIGIPDKNPGEVVGFGDKDCSAIQRKRHEQPVRKGQMIARNDRWTPVWNMLRAFGDRAAAAAVEP